MASNAPGHSDFLWLSRFSPIATWHSSSSGAKTVPPRRVVALLGTTVGQPTIVLSRSADVDVDVSALLKEAMATVGTRRRNKDLAQGGVPEASRIPELLDQLGTKLMS